MTTRTSVSVYRGGLLLLAVILLVMAAAPLLVWLGLGGLDWRGAALVGFAASFALAVARSPGTTATLLITFGIPLVYELEDDLTPIRNYYLGDPEAARKAAEAVAKQASKS